MVVLIPFTVSKKNLEAAGGYAAELVRTNPVQGSLTSVPRNESFNK